MDIIRNGYGLPFTSIPQDCFIKNNKSALMHPKFVEDAIFKLLEDGCIQEVSSPPRCVNPLSVAEEKKLRLVLDLRHVNPHLHCPKFKYDDLACLSEIFEQNFWFFTWDLKSGYHQVSIRYEHRCFLGFSWTINDVLRFFIFNVLPFGLCSACFCFTKIIRSFIRRWRSLSHRCLAYIDDGISGYKTRQLAIEASNIQKNDFAESGFIYNIDKSRWDPMQIGQWLGFMIDTIRFQFKIPQEKIQKIEKFILSLLNSNCVTFRGVARLAGLIISVTIAVGPIARLFTRQMCFILLHRSRWDDTFIMPHALLEEVKFWHQHIRALSGFEIRPNLQFTLSFHTDASRTAFGGISSNPDFKPVRGMFSSFEQKAGSTFRELKAIYYVLLTHSKKLHVSHVKIFSDNQGACRITLVGSRKKHLQQLAVDIFALSVKYSFVIRTQWIRRDENQIADHLSKFVDFDDWQINLSTFLLLNAKWGPFTVDRFASYYNNQLNRFNTRYVSPGSEAVDALAQDWSHEINWVCPPIYLIPKVIRHMKCCRAKGVLIVSEWHSGLFWPVLCKKEYEFEHFVKDVFVLPKIHDLILVGPGQTSVYKKKRPVFSGCPVFNMLALKIDFS